MEGGKEVHGTLVLLEFLDPTHHCPMVLLTVELKSVPTSLGGRAKERKRTKDRNLERASFVFI